MRTREPLLCALAVLAAALAPTLALAGLPDDYPPQLNAAPSGAAPQKAPPEYLGADTVPLTKREQRALRLARGWTGRGPAPVLSFSGKVTYVHGASMPTIIGSPMQVCDVELQKGEKVHEIVVGDSARWMIESGATGTGSNETVHLFIKPVDAGLESTAVVTTDRRVYHLRLLSRRSGHTPYVGFTYADQLTTDLAERRTAEARAARWNTTDGVDGQSVDLSRLNFGYEVKGKAAWKPQRVYDDGQQTFIRLPDGNRTPEIPVLLVRKGKRDILVNYRVIDKAMVVDGVFDKISLVLGVGSAQEEVIISRSVK